MTSFSQRISSSSLLTVLVLCTRRIPLGEKSTEEEAKLLRVMTFFFFLSSGGKDE